MPVQYSDWTLVKNESGIQVYTRTITGSGIKDVRVVNTVKSSLSGLIALFLDVEKYPEWMYACRESKVLRVVNSRELYNYVVTDLPWPFSDRDVISHFTLEQDSLTKIVTFTKTGEPAYIPEVEDYVRVPHFKSVYKLIPVNRDSVNVQLETHIDPGGNLPDWLINSNLINAPFKTTLEMINMLPRYQSASFPYIREFYE
jgi:hypothetical protein